MDWLTFLIGALAGWLVSWLIDYLICRPRRLAVQASWNAQLQRCNQECTALTAQLSGHQDLQERHDAANLEIATLKAQVAGMNDLQVRLESANRQAAGLQAQSDGAKVELESLKAQVAGLKDKEQRLDIANTQVGALQEQLTKLRGAQADLVSWKARVTEQDLEIQRLNAELTVRAGAGAAAGAVAAPDLTVPAAGAETEVVTPTIPMEGTGVALAVPAPQPAEPDDLTRIEGIGPKISALLNQHGLYTFAQLAAAGVEQLQEMLNAAGPRFRLANPQTWPEQALLARDGKWDALQTLQDTLTVGRRA